jgi:putative Holliday junction resolvase
MSVIALDFGERRIGVAASDPLGLTAQPLTVIERGSLEEDLARIEAIVKQRRADRIVLGLPLNMDGTVGPQAKRVRRFAARLKRALGLEIVLWDERLTTVEAETVGQEHVYPEQSRRAPAARERERRRRRTDAVAAAVILQDYLQAQRRKAEQ